MTEQTRDIHDLMAQGAVATPEKILGQEEKESLADAGTQFIVNSIQYGDDADFGAFWQVQATLDNRPISFRLSQHERRDPFMQSLAAALTSGPIAGLRLKAYKAKNGNAFVSLEAA